MNLLLAVFMSITVISGVVTTDGAPVAGATVGMTTYDIPAQRPACGKFQVYTDTAGRYEMPVTQCFRDVPPPSVVSLWVEMPDGSRTVGFVDGALLVDGFTRNFRLGRAREQWLPWVYGGAE